MRGKIFSNNLFIRIIATVVVGIVCLVTMLSGIMLLSSKEAFLEIFSESQRKIFSQIDSEFYIFYRDMTEITEQIADNKNVQKYLSGKFESPLEERKCIMAVEDVIENSFIHNYPDCNIFLVGNSGVTHIYKGNERLIMEVKDIMSSKISIDALSHTQTMVLQRMESGFTDMTEDVPMVVFAKAIEGESVVFITIQEEKFQELYSYFTSNTSDIMIFNRHEEIISSNNPMYVTGEHTEIMEIVAQMEEQNLSHMKVKDGMDVKLYQLQRFQNTNYKIFGIVDPNKAFDEQYPMKNILCMTSGITFVVAIVLWKVVRKLTRPLYELVDTMEKVGENNLEVYAEEKGTLEIQQLSRTYNKMMQEINAYIQKIFYVEEEKRKTEIHALQMQIKPHYIYNTLTSIKFLVWQNDMEKAVQMIDAFISLLRNTISNTNKFVTIEQDIENLKNYVFINQVRFGDHVKVEYFVTPDCNDYKIPKLILQPFVENAFFHAFPNHQKGYIHVFIRKENTYLKIDIKDNGIGFNQDRLLALEENDELKKERFNGIGMNNVDERIKLIYGFDYGINIKSEEGKGTTITLYFPLDFEEK